MNMLRGLKHPKRHLEGSEGAHTHTHEGKCGKSQMPSQHHSRESTWRALLGGPAAQGCSTRQAEAPGAQPQPLPCPRDSWEHQEQGCGHGALALTSRAIWMCPGGQAAASVPLLAIPRFGSVSRGVGEQSCRSSRGKSQQLLPSKGCFPALLVALLPRCWWGDRSECLVFPKQCVLCASCHPVVLPVASEPPKLMQTCPSSTERSGAASRQPFPQVFPSG